MKAEIITTGKELLIGRVLNRHQEWLGQRLTELGYSVTRQVTVSDEALEIRSVLEAAMQRAGLVISTGGLGPTSDDRTRESLSALLGRPLREDADTLQRIGAFFAARGRPIPVSTRIQALAPEGAFVLPNSNGTAPGLVLEGPFPIEDSMCRCIVLLPGPPREMHPMFTQQVVPRLLQHHPPERRLWCATWRTTGVGESVVAERIEPLLEDCLARGAELSYCARMGEVDIRLMTSHQNLIDEADRRIRLELGNALFGTGDQTLEQVVVHMLREKRITLAVAESCTGGLISHRLTNVPGASDVFLCGITTYSNQAKHDLLGVQPCTLAEHGAVSAPTAREMAEGARTKGHADIGLSVTGIAGPGGGSPEKPVGTVFAGIATAEGTQVERLFNPYDRETFKQITSQQALNRVRQVLL